jgi:hypothetical protein
VQGKVRFKDQLLEHAMAISPQLTPLVTVHTLVPGRYLGDLVWNQWLAVA